MMLPLCTLAAIAWGTSLALATEAAAATQQQSITLEDLIRVAQIEYLTVSPDGRFATYVVITPRLSQDDYLSELFLVRTDGMQPPERLALFTSLPRLSDDGGLPKTGADVLWARDGSSVSFFRPGRAGVDLWMRRIPQMSERLIASGFPDDTRLEAWAANVASIVVSRQEEHAIDSAHAVASDPGILMDRDKIFAFARGKVLGQSSHEALMRTYSSVSIQTGTLSTLAEAEARSVLQPSLSYAPPKSRPVFNDWIARSALSPDGRRWALKIAVVRDETDEHTAATDHTEIRVLDVAEGANPHILVKSVPIGSELAWANDSRAIRLIMPDLGETRVETIDLESKTRRTLYRTAWNLRNVRFLPDGRHFLAVRQQPAKPPELVTVALTGRALKVRALHRPNAWMDQTYLPPHKLVYVVDRFGYSRTLRITLPNGYESGRRYPSVATTYLSGNDFQLGAVGNEYPIYGYAAHGFVVISLDDSSIALLPSQIGRIENTVERVASPVSAIEEAIRLLASEGLVDAGRCGITGLSYGAEIANYAIFTSDAFRAVAASSGGLVMTPVSYHFSTDQWVEKYFPLRGLPFPDQEGLKAWSAISPQLNARRVRAPLLVQPAQTEVLQSAPLHSALRHLGVPVEMIAYPGEGHVKMSPRTKYWVYQRNLDWMRFWLKGEEDPDPAKAEQYARWRKLREQQAAVLKERPPLLNLKATPVPVSDAAPIPN